ncbi:MAG: DsbA family protein [Burkholderiaceae bacterium]
MPPIAERLLSRERLLRRRDAAERARRARGAPHTIHLFHQVDDPHGALLAAALPGLVRRYDVVLDAQVVDAPADDVAPERARLIAWARRDAARLARRHGLAFDDAGASPPPTAIAATQARLVEAITAGRFLDEVGPATDALWATAAQAAVDRTAAQSPAAPAPTAAVAGHLARAGALRTRLGHYLGATLYYAGEWYWGLDRLHHLEARLQSVGAARAGTTGAMFPPDVDPVEPFEVTRPAPIDFFFSLRSPYSALAAPRVLALGRLAGVPVRLRWLLPMVMRGLPVPRAKRTYIAADAAREAHLRGLPFGRLADPVGRPTERGLSLFPLAEREGVGDAYLLSFMRGVWAEGVDAGTDRGLRRVAERAGLDWAACRDALHDDGWRAVAEGHREALFGHGLWGVPAFAVGGDAVWGQDRLWAVREALGGPR